MAEDERLLHLFTYELNRQCELSLQAVELWRRAYDGLPHVPPGGDPTADPSARARAELALHVEYVRRTELALLHAHAFLAHAANASKILWPSPPRGHHPYTKADRERRAATMRVALGVADDSPLKSRDLRDHFEHLDERLEVWYQSEAGGRLDLLDVNRLPFGLSSPEALVSELRMFGQGELRVLGTSYKLAPIQLAVIAVAEASARWLDGNRRILDERRA